MIKRLLILGILIPFAYAIAPAQQTGDDSALFALVRRNYNGESSFAAAFSVDQYWVVREKHIKESGVADVATGNRFRVKMGGDEWVSDGKSLWSYSKPSNQVVIRQLDNVEGDMIPSSVFSRYLTAGRFRVISRHDGVAQLEIKGDSASPYASAAIWVREDNGIINRGQMTDHNGNTFTYKVTNYQTDIPVTTADFAFDKAKFPGVEVIDMR